MQNIKTEDVMYPQQEKAQNFQMLKGVRSNSVFNVFLW